MLVDVGRTCCRQGRSPSALALLGSIRALRGDIGLRRRKRGLSGLQRGIDGLSARNGRIVMITSPVPLKAKPHTCRWPFGTNLRDPGKKTC